ncbi:MAG: lasso RiPP family leader peptide-containing protein [Acidobacteriota bacterium]
MTPHSLAPRSLETSTRRPYRRPSLTAYGDLREVTRAFNSFKGVTDGKGGGLLKTGGF